MLSSTGRFIISYNGELYNEAELREELAKSGWTSEWRGHSDTETLLACIETYGVERTLAKIVGVAIALWDRQERAFILARAAWVKSRSILDVRTTNGSLLQS